MAEILYTRYEANQKHKDYSDDWLEETSAGHLPKETRQLLLKLNPTNIRDKDKDGFIEVKKSALESILKAANSEKSTFTLASYFEDKKSSKENSKRLKNIPPLLAKAIKANDFTEAGKFFTEDAKGSENPLEKEAKMLALYLSAQAMHAGLNVAEDVDFEATQSGFSVHGSGRLRIDCVLFSQLAQHVLKGIPGIEFDHLTLKSRENSVEPEVAQKGEKSQQIVYAFETPDSIEDSSASSSGYHRVLLAGDKRGNYLIVSNESVYYFQTTDLAQKLKENFGKEYESYVNKTTWVEIPF